MANPYDQFDEDPAPQVLAQGNALRPVKDRQDVTKGGIDIADGTTDLRINRATEAAQIRKANAEADITEGKRGDTKLDNAMKLRSAFDGMPPVKEYRVGIAQLATGLKTAPNATGDNALIYAYAKTMDPASVVRESEMGMAASGQSVFDSVAAQYKKQFGIDGGGQLSPQVRDRLRREMLNKATELNRSYNAQRVRFIQDAVAFGLDPARVVGKHDGDLFRPELKRFTEAQSLEGATGAGGKPSTFAPPAGSAAPPSPYGRPVQRDESGFYTENEYGARFAYNPQSKDWAADMSSPDSYAQSPVAQGLNGVNEGIATTLGAPVDLTTGILNLPIRGFNALANANLPTIEDPFGGSGTFKNLMTSMGSIGEPAGTPGLQSLRRVGQSVGGAVIPAGFAGNAARAGGVMLSGLAGGVGGATAQRVAPGNILAEMAGEMAGGGFSVAGLNANARRINTNQMKAAIPTVDDLKAQAGQLYRQAENRGVVANPKQTQTLADQMRSALQAEGQITPEGRVLTDSYPAANSTVRLVDDYAGKTMTPTEMQPVRKMAASGLSSDDGTERRLGRILTDVIDNWSDPLAPELKDARGISSRYLTAETLEKQRDLATANSSLYTGSGFENALRNQYRQLDRADIKDQMQFPPAVSDAIQKVNRGTPLSNAARGVGKWAPTGVVPTMGGAGAGAFLGSMMGSPILGGVIGGGTAALGHGGRALATRMGLGAAEDAELTARFGGKLPKMRGLTDEDWRAMNLLFGAESAKYLQDKK